MVPFLCLSFTNASLILLVQRNLMPENGKITDFNRNSVIKAQKSNLPNETPIKFNVFVDVYTNQTDEENFDNSKNRDNKKQDVSFI